VDPKGARRVDPNCTFALRRLADLYERIGKTSEAQGARDAFAVASAQTTAAIAGR